jgi:hypothetical protein
MPFKSDKQRKYMWLKHPEIAKRWTQEEGKEGITKRLQKQEKKRK